MENNGSTTQSKGMSKTLIIAGVVVLLFILLGLGAYLVMGNKAIKSADNQAVNQAANPTTGGMFSSIKDALSKSVSLKCEYTDETGKKSVSYIKGGAIRSDYSGVSAQESGSVIMKDKKMYFWNGKEGMMMEFDPSQMAISITPGAKNQASGQGNPEDVIESLEKFKDNCKPSTVSDSLFTPPSDVKFTDMSEMMKAGQKMQHTMPTGGMTEEQMKELQKKFQQ